MNSCKICENSTDNKLFTALEMMRGTRTKFNFLECGLCGTVQLLQSDLDMSAYYDNSIYGSFSPQNRSSFKTSLRRIRNTHAILGTQRLLGAILNRISPLPPDFTIIKEYATTKSKILDVGCGAGAYIRDLADIGFSNVTGVDPYVSGDLTYANGVVIRKMHFHEIRDHYDIILSHHSFEHVAEPFRALSAIKNSLTEGGTCLLTMPVAEDLYREFRENCYLLQAPQHPFLYSIRGFQAAAKTAGLVVERTVRDASDASAWAKYSESWKRNTAMNELAQNFGTAELEGFAEMQQKLTSKKLGDNATFVLRHAYA